jgi:hypothetical protein
LEKQRQPDHAGAKVLAADQLDGSDARAQKLRALLVAVQYALKFRRAVLDKDLVLFAPVVTSFAAAQIHRKIVGIL